MVGLAIGLLVCCPVGRAAGRPVGVSPFWERVAICETGGLWNWGEYHRHLEGHTYEGGVGFYYGTWLLWAGKLGLAARYPHAWMASPAIQARVAAYGLAHGGYWGSLHNGCAGR